MILEQFALYKNFNFIWQSLSFDLRVENVSNEVWYFYNVGTIVIVLVDHPQLAY